MNRIKTLILTACTTLLIFTSVLYSSCNGLDSKCQSIICLNGGSCSKGKCTCSTGYEGANCQLLSGEKFAGQWLWNQQPFFRPIAITTSEQHPTLLFVQWFPHGPIKNLLCTITSPNQFIIQPNQGDSISGKILEGSGTIDSLGFTINGSVKWQYTLHSWPNDSTITEIVPMHMERN